MATVATFRKLALALPDAVESAHHDHPDFRVQGRVFASLHQDGAKGMVKLPPAEQQRLVTTQPAAFRAVNGAWGRQGCTWVTLATIDTAALREALTCAWQAAMALPAAKPRRPRRQ